LSFRLIKIRCDSPSHEGDDEMNKLVPFLLGNMVHSKGEALGERRVLKGNYDFHPMDHWVNMEELQRTVCGSCRLAG